MRAILLALTPAAACSTAIPPSSSGPYVSDLRFVGDQLLADTCYLTLGGEKHDVDVDVVSGRITGPRTLRSPGSAGCRTAAVRLSLPRGIAPPGWMPTACRPSVERWRQAEADLRGANRWRAHQACMARRAAVASRFRDPENRKERLRLSIGMPTCRPVPPRIEAAPTAGEIDRLWSAIPNACRRYTRP